MRNWYCLVAVASTVALGSDAALLPEPVPLSGQPAFHVEKMHVEAGADLLTVYGKTREADIPLLAVLRDTFGDADPANDKLRYVWVLTATRPSLAQRATAAVPFFYFKAGIPKRIGRPQPLMDMSSPRRPVWNALAGNFAQILAADPEGALVRSATRSYRNNTRDQRQMHLLEGLSLVSQMETVPEVRAEFSERELLAVEARLSLAGQIFGGLVSDATLPRAYANQRTRTLEERGHNWELLRQKAESNGLIFEPFGAPGAPTQAMLWVSRDALLSENHPIFDGRFLSISDPYADPSLKNWNGYLAHRDGQELIPLALYSLDHTKVPFLLVNFRASWAPRRREMFRHAIVDGVNGVAGISMWGNWPYLAGSYAWNFVRSRHGAATQRSERIRAYSSARQWLALDTSLDPDLRKDLERRLARLGVNPLEDSLSSQSMRAQKQYAELEKWVESSNGLTHRIEDDRNAERVAQAHGFGARLGLNLVHWGTFGAYTHREDPLQERFAKARLVKATAGGAP